MNSMIDGATAMGLLVIALFFLRFWRNSGDRFFLFFSLSFLVQGAHRIYVAWPNAHPGHEDNPLHYLFRLLGYLLILWAILEKNRPMRKAQRAGD